MGTSQFILSRKNITCIMTKETRIGEKISTYR